MNVAAEAGSASIPGFWHKASRLALRDMDLRVVEARIVLTLNQAVEHVRQGRAHIERQQQIIEQSRCDGSDTSLAVSLLQTLQEAQILHEEAVRKLEEELVTLRSKQNLHELSRHEMRHRLEGRKEAQVLLDSSAEAIEGSRALLKKLPDKF